MSKMFLDTEDLQRLLERHFYGFEVRIITISDKGVGLEMKQTSFFTDLEDDL